VTTNFIQRHLYHEDSHVINDIANETAVTTQKVTTTLTVIVIDQFTCCVHE
jgi:hypothetical protein